MALDPELVEAQLSLGQIHPEAMPNLAADALEAGLDGPAIRRLAGLLQPSGWETDQLKARFMDECGLSHMSLEDAALRMARHLARRILHEELDPLDFQRDFYHLWLAADYAGELQELGNLDDALAVGYTRETVRKSAFEELSRLLSLPRASQ